MRETLKEVYAQELPAMNKSICYVGIDNGVSGSIGIICGTFNAMMLMPTKKELSYTKNVRNITRINNERLQLLFEEHITLLSQSVKVFLERPMVNPMRFQATISAIRALESTVIVLERLKLSLQYIDSRQWQKALLPAGIKGSVDLKKASLDIGCRLFPNLSQVIIQQGDADGLLMAEAARRGSW